MWICSTEYTNNGPLITGSVETCDVGISLGNIVALIILLITFSIIIKFFKKT